MMDMSEVRKEWLKTGKLPDDYSPYPKSFVGQVIRSFSHLTEYLTGTGGWKVTPLQQQLLDAFLLQMEPDIRTLVEHQLAQPFFIQFWHKGRISPFFFQNFRLPQEIRLPCPEFDDRLYKIEMFVDGRKQHAQIVFVSGRIYSIEFKKPFKFYKNKWISFGVVTIGRAEQSQTVTLDKQEHGENGHYATGED